jgi:hypothetical protein
VPNGFTEQDRKDFDHLKQDMWYGNGKAGVTTRAEKLEYRMDKVEKKQSLILTLAWAILLVLIGNLVETIRVDQARPQQPIQHSDLY